MKWLKEENIFLHWQVHKKDFPKITIYLNRSISSSKNPTITLQYVSERLLQLLIWFKIFLLTSCQKKIEKEQPNKIWGVASVSW